MMKALVFGDTHGDVFVLELLKRKAEQADIVLCLGDLTIFGEELKYMLTILNEFPAPVYLIHGNHELEEDMEKFYEKGNKAAGTRARKQLQNLKKLAQEIRLEIQDKKNAE